jgi:hypothetical protein
VFAAGLAHVTNGNDSGEGSLREALEVKQANLVVISKSVEDIVISDTLMYSGRTPLSIIGSGQKVKLAANATILAVTQGADLTISDIDFEGQPGEYSITNRGDQGEAAGKGIFIDVRDDQTGTVNLRLSNVSVSGVANHGIHVSDCSLADDCGGGSGGDGDGSPASISVIFNKVTIQDAGNGKFDADGLRVDDRGEGGIYFFARKSLFTDIGADGVELDEGDDGDVVADIRSTVFSNNGGYCDPTILEAYLPDPDEDEFDESEAVTEDQIPGNIAGSEDDKCFEREVDTYDSGFVEAYEFGIDLDDGIDIDEAGEGSVISTIKGSVIAGNLDEGLDYDEEDEGSIVSRIYRSHAYANRDDGFKHSEEGSGDVDGLFIRSTAYDNGGKGVVFEEEGEGDLSVTVKRSETYNNDDSDDTGIEVVQEDEGAGTLKVRNSSIADGIDLDGVEAL